MSIHSTLMRAGVDLQLAVQGDAGPSVLVKYRTPEGKEFEWPGSSPGAQHGGLLPIDNGDVLKVFRCRVKGPTAVLVANGVKELQRDAVIKVYGQEWAVDLEQSTWGELMVMVDVFRRPISRHEEMQAKFERR